jgi:hypothetical protein
MKRLVNNERQVIALESGIMLGAAGREGSVRVVEDNGISADEIARYVDTGRIAMTDAPASAARESATEAPDAGKKGSK